MNHIKQYIVLGIIVLAATQNAWAVTVGEKMPDCNLKPLNDVAATLHLNRYSGKVLYVDFWASWCAPCAKSFPYMNKLQRTFKSSDLQIVAVNLDQPLSDADEFLTKLPADFTLAYDPEQVCAKSFAVQAMPSTYLIDKQGIVRYIHLGFRSGEVGELQQMIETLVAED